MTRGNAKTDFSDGGFGETLSKIKSIESEERKAYEDAVEKSRERLAQARGEAETIRRNALEDAAKISAESYVMAVAWAKAEADSLRADAEGECGKVRVMKPPKGLAEELMEMIVS